MNNLIRFYFTLVLGLLFVFLNTVFSQTSSDVTIGTQVWMSKNLDISTFRNGEAIPEIKTREDWKKAGDNKQPAYCYYEFDEANGKKYGKLYNWYAVNDARGLAPNGYHVPSDKEWKILEDFLGGDSVAGYKMKSTEGWKSYTDGEESCPNCQDWTEESREKETCSRCNNTRYISIPETPLSGNGDNSSGFNALPVSYFTHDVSSFYFGDNGYWWSSTEFAHSEAWVRTLFNFSFAIDTRWTGKEYGFSVRCIKD
jgi:uncharacterized protein (TIGR02145 family)